MQELTDEENRQLLEKLAIDLIGVCNKMKPRTEGVDHIILNCLMYKSCKQLQENGINVRLPYYWGPHGVHVVYKQFTNMIKLTMKDPIDADFVRLGDIDAKTS